MSRLKARLTAGALLALVAAVSAIALAGAASATSSAAPTNTTKPTVTDSNFQVGDTVTAHPGDWTDSPTSYSYRWTRCDVSGQNCNTIAGATADTYLLSSTDVDNRLVVQVTATNASGAASAASDPTVVISSDSAPSNQQNPTISGTPEVGQTLTADEGSWQGGVRSYSYLWRQCDASGGACADIGSATNKTYVAQTADIGKTLRVEVTAHNPAGTRTATSDRSAVISAPAQPAACGTTADKVTTLPDGSKSVAIADVAPPDRLVIDRVGYSPGSISHTGQLVTGRFHVSETVGGCSVSGALLYAVGVPFNSLTTAAEQATGSDGWVSVSFRVRGGQRLSRGDLVVLFLRARKPGDNLLAGISTRRLVSIRYLP